MPDPQHNTWDRRRGSNSSNWSDASSNPASINQRPREPQDGFAPQIRTTGMIHRNPFQNPSPVPSVLDTQLSLQPPSAPFSNGGEGSLSTSSSKVDLSSGANLSVSYLPAKFSRPLSPGLSYRKANKAGDALLKRGGGRDAFATGASRMPGVNEDDYDGVDPGFSTGKLRWNKFKWILFSTNTILTVYSIAALVFALLIWFNIWSKSEVILQGNRAELTASTVAAAACIFTSLIGWAGILLNNRSFLAVYTVLLWITFVLLVTPGYMTYRRRAFNLEGKVNSQWSRSMGVEARLIVQNVLGCCGYFSPFIEASISARCYSRSTLPGCKGPYLNFQREILHTWYAAAFILVPFHLACIIAALLCSNHITYRFGKGMMPKAYRLNSEAMAIIMESFASNLAEQYGGEAVSEIMGTMRQSLAAGDAFIYPPTGSRSRDSSNSGHDLSPGGVGFGSYGSSSGLVLRDDGEQRTNKYSNADRGREKRL